MKKERKEGEVSREGGRKGMSREGGRKEGYQGRKGIKEGRVSRKEGTKDIKGRLLPTEGKKDKKKDEWMEGGTEGRKEGK